MNTVERAEDIAAEVLGNLVAESIDNATVTADLLKVPAALANGPVVAIQPPKINFVTYELTEYTWELFVIAGPYADRLAAWKTIDPIIAALRRPMNIDDAEPATFSHPSMPDYPAYVLTFTETI